MSDYLPEGIVEKILLRLPVKCVIKCTAVSKSWRSLIKSSNFIQTHLSRTVQSNHHKNEHLFLLGSFVEKEQRTVFSLHWDNPEYGEYTRLEDPFHFINPCDLPLESQTTLHFHDVIGTCNGLICLADRDYQRKLIWNPCIRKFVILPNPSVNFTHTTTGKGRAIHAFGYDSHSNDYKVVRIMCIVGINWSLTPGEVEVYSLARGSWKRLNATAFPKDSRLSYGEEYAFVNGAVHWLAQHYKFRNMDNIIVWFDMSTESFGRILVPESLREESCYVSRYGESLALINLECISSSSLHLWILKEYGVAESWTKLFSISLQGFAHEPLALISLTKTGVIAVLERYSKQGMLSVDIKSRQVGEFAIDGHKLCFLDSFVGSMVLLDQSSAISY